VTLPEGDAGTTAFNFTLSIAEPSVLPVSVNAQTADGSAVAGTDYTALPITPFTIAPGNLTQVVTISVNGDADVEPDETFFVNLSAPVNATIGGGQGVGTIQNDDAPANTITLTPATLNLLTQDSASLDVTLDSPAGAGGQIVALSSDNASVATVPPSVTIPAGNTVASAPITTATTAGTAIITGSATGFASGTSTVNVAERTMSIALVDTALVGVGELAVLEITLDQPAPAGGATIAVTSDNTGIVDVQAPGTAFIPATQTTGTVTLQGIAAGITNVRANSPGYTEAVLSVEATLQIISVPPTLNVPLGQTASLPVNIPDPAPTGGLVFDVSSNDPSFVGVLTPTVTIPQGAFGANATLDGVSPGTALVTVSNPSYASGQTVVTTSAALNIVEGSVSFSSVFTNTTITVQLESVGSPVAAPAPGVEVSLVSDDPDCVTVPSPVTIPTGLVNVDVTLTYGGTAPLPCTATVTAAGSVGVTADTVAVTVNPAPGIGISGLPRTVGAGLQSFCCTVVLGAGDHGGVTVLVASDDPAVSLVAPNTTTPGAAFIEVPVANGLTTFSFVVQGVENAVGTANINVSASGFTPNSSVVTVVQSALDLIGVQDPIDSLDPDDVFRVRVGRPNAGNTALSSFSDPVRTGIPGGALIATVTHDNAAVGNLVQDGLTEQVFTVPIPEGATASINNAGPDGLAHSPVANGTATIAATIPGLIATDNASQSVTVTSPVLGDISGLPRTVGAGLQSFCCSVTLSASQHGGVTLRIQSADPAVALVAPNATTDGTEFFDVSLPNGATSASFVVQGVENAVGTADIDAFVVAGPIFTPTSDVVTVVQSALDLVGVQDPIDSLDPDDIFRVRVGRPNAGNTALSSFGDPVRIGIPGGALIATVTHDDAAVGNLVQDEVTEQVFTVPIPQGSTASINNAGPQGVAHRPVANGTATIAATIPGLIATNAASRSVTVTSPVLGDILGLPRTVGAGLQSFCCSVTLSASQHGGVTLRIQSADPAVALVAPNPSTAGTEFFDVSVPNGATTTSFVVQGVENAVGTADIDVFVVAGPIFTPTSDVVTVVQSALDLVSVQDPIDNLDPDDVFRVRVGRPNAGNTALSNFSDPVRIGIPGGELIATVTHDNSSVGNLVQDGVTGQVFTVPIPQGLTQSINNAGPDGIAHRPVANGTATIAATVPGLIATDDASQSVTVTTPTIAVSGLPRTVGAGLQSFCCSVTLSASQHGGVTVHVESTNAAVARVSPNPSTAGTEFIDVFVPDGQTTFSFVVQGIEDTTGTVAITVTAPGFLDATGTLTVDVVQAGIDLINVNPNQSAGGPDDVFRARVGRPNANASALANVNDPVRAGFGGGTGPLEVTITNADPAVGELVQDGVTSQSVVVSIPQGVTASANDAGPTGVAFRPLAAGTTDVSGTATDFIATDDATQTIDVSPASLSGGIPPRE
jgi:hypothetical protein